MATHPSFPGIEFDFVFDANEGDPDLEASYRKAARDWVFFDRATPEHLGYIPSFLSVADHRSAKEQLDANYAFGGFRPQKGFTRNGLELQYPEDPPMKPLAFTEVHGEIVVMYPYGYVMVLQPDDSFEVARMD